MENFKNQTCEFLPHACNAGIEKPKPAVKPENKPVMNHVRAERNNFQKPWSIFGDVYWI